MYLHTVTYYAEGTGSYDANRVFTPGSPSSLWTGKADVQDAPIMLMQQSEEANQKFDARVYHHEGDVDDVINLISLGTQVETPYGVGEVAMIRRLDGWIGIRWVG